MLQWKALAQSATQGRMFGCLPRKAFQAHFIQQQLARGSWLTNL